MGSMLRRGGFGEPQMTTAGFSGSARAQDLIRLADSNSDSVDVLTIGDSNIGYNNYGYGVGVYKAMQGLAQEYATGIMPGSISTGSVSGDAVVGGLAGDDITLNYNDHDQAGSVGNVKTLVEAASTNSDAFALEITGHLGMNLGSLPSMLGDARTYAGSFVASGVTYTSPANNNCIIVGTTSAINGASASLQHRVVYGTFSSGSGTFKNIRWANFTAVLSSANATSGGVGVSTTQWNFSAPSTLGAYRVGWDGFNNGAGDRAVGPIAVLAQSIIRRSTKGFAHTNVMRDPGKSTTQLADRIEAMDKLLDVYLRESKDRQIEAGGTGNVVVVITSGINGSETSSSFTTNTQRIIDRIKARWSVVSGDASKLAFIVVPTHPVTATINTWTANRSGILSDANSWAAGQSGVCVYDIAVSYPAATIDSNGWYAGSGSSQAHLTNTGYSTICSALINNLVS